MKSRNLEVAEAGFSSVHEVISLLKPGGCFVISVPTPATGACIASAIVSSDAEAGSIRAITLRAGPLCNIPGERLVSLHTIRSLREALGAVKVRIRGLPSNRRLLLDVSGPAASWYARPGARWEFTRKSILLLRKGKCRQIIIACAEDFTEAQWLELKDETDFLLCITALGDFAVAQFLSARGIFRPAFFLPRRIVLHDESLALTQNAELATQSPPEPAASAQTSSREILALLEEPYRRAFEGAGEGMVLVDFSSGFREANARALQLLGCSRQEFAGGPLAPLVGEENVTQVLRSALELRSRGRFSVDVRIRKRNGKKLILAAAGSKVTAGLFLVVLRDVTELRKAEKQLDAAGKVHRAIMDASPYPQATAFNRRLDAWNEAFRRAFPSVGTGAEAKPSLRRFFGRENKSFIAGLLDLCEKGGGLEGRIIGEVGFPGPEGGRAFEVSAIPLGDGGAVHLTFVDVTGRNDAVRRLGESEQAYRALIENTLGAIVVLRDSRIVMANRGFLVMSGYANPEEVVGKNFSDIVAQRERKTIEERLSNPVKRPNRLPRFEFTGVRKDGSKFSADAQCEGIVITGIPSLLCYLRDITGEKKTQLEVRRKLKEQEIVERILHAFQHSLTLQDVLSAGVRASLRWLGFDAAGVYPAFEETREIALGHHESLPEAVASAISRQSLDEGITGYVAKTREPLLLSIAGYPAYLPYKSLFAAAGYQSVLYIPLLAGEKLCGILFLCSVKSPDDLESDLRVLASLGGHFGDAVNNAMTFERVNALERRYRDALENIGDVVYHALPSGAFVYVNARVESIVGLKPAELLLSPEAWRSVIHPDDRADYSKRISQQATGESSLEIEYRVLPKGKASYRWVRDAVTYRRDERGEVVALHGVVTDVTRRVEAAAEIENAGERRHDVLRDIQVGVVLYDREFVCRDWNRMMEMMTGIPAAEMVGKKPQEAGSQFLLPRLPSLLREALDGKSVTSEDAPFRRPDNGSEVYFWGRFAPVRDDSGLTTGVVATIVDVTERKSLEAEVRESEETLRKVVDAMGDAMMISDLEGRVWEVNREFVNITGYARHEVLGKTFPYPWLVEEEMATVVAWIAALRENRFLRDFDMTWKSKDGRRVAISLNTSLLRNATGEPVAMLNLARDITDRRRLTRELEGKNRQIEMVNRIISAANTTMDFARIFETISTEVLALITYDQINVGLLTGDGEHIILHACVSPTVPTPPVGTVIPLSETVSQLAVRSGQPMVIGDLAREAGLGPGIASVREGLKANITIPLYLHNRILGTFNVASVEANAFSGAEVALLQPIADQIGAIIDRTRLFNRVSDDSLYIRNLLNSIDSVMFTVDQEYRIREVNQAWRSFALVQGTGQFAEESQVIGRTIEEVIAPGPLVEDLREVMPKIFDGALEGFTRDYEIGPIEMRRAYNLVINAMVINARVTGLVCTLTDVTGPRRAESEILTRNRELIALNALSTSLGKSLNLDELLSVGLDRIMEVGGADAAVCYLSGDHPNTMILGRSVGIPVSFQDEIRMIDLSAGAAGDTIGRGVPIFISRDAAADGRFAPKTAGLLGRLGIQGFAALPLLAKERTVGVTLLGFRDSHDFSEQEERFLILIGNQIGSAVENARLYAEVSAQVQRITSLYEFGKRLTGALDTRTVLDVVYKEIATTIPVDRFSFHTFSESRRTLTRVYDVDGGRWLLESDEPRGRVSVIAAGSVLGHVVDDARAYVGAGEEGESLIALPFLSKQKAVGVLSIIRHAPDAYTVAHLRLLQSIATLSEIAMDRALLYEDIVAKSAEIEYRNKELDDFTYVVSHDLKEPLITIEGYSKIILGEYGRKLDEEATGYLSAVVQSSLRMKNLIDDLLTLSRLGRVSEQQQTVEVGKVLEDVLRDFEFTLRQRQATIELPQDLPDVRYNATQLSMVFRNLISNAIKFNTSRNPRVRVKFTANDAEYLFSVSDNGIGIDSKHFEKIFVIFQRLHRSEEYLGTGAGLTIVKKIVENHRGRIWVESVVGEGTTFHFTVPR